MYFNCDVKRNSSILPGLSATGRAEQVGCVSGLVISDKRLSSSTNLTLSYSDAQEKKYNYLSSTTQVSQIAVNTHILC